MKAVYLLLSITSFTGDSQVTNRYILIPQASQAQCEATLKHSVIMHSSGRPADLMACVSYKWDRRDE